MTATPPYPSAPPPGLTVDGYELRARLGEGGMGVVHLAQRRGQRPVALKVLRPNVVGDDEARRRLAREVDSLSRVRSHLVAEVLDADPWGTIPYVATRYVPGLTLHDHASQEGPIVGGDLLWFAECLAEALAAVHAVGVLHRDIKPSNVILEGRTPILIDFGLARLADDVKVTQTGFLLGTPGYLAPEILFGEEATEISDVHSWAATVAFAAQARSPFGGGPPMAVMDRVRRGEHDLGDVDGEIRELLTAALVVDPDQRPDLAEVREWLSELSDSAPRRWDRPETPPATMPYASLALDPTPPGMPPTVVETGATQTHPLPGSGEWSAWTPVEPVVRVGIAERLRGAVLVAASGAALAGATAAAPWVTLVGIAVMVWVLRVGSLASSGVERRRLTRGHPRWWDAAAGVLSTPWHLVGSVPATGGLLLWSLGLGAAAGLVAYALALRPVVALALVGLTVACGVWWGPGSGRFRGPARRATGVIASRPVAWFLVVLLLVAFASGSLGYAQTAGINWTPAGGAPFSTVDGPAWL